MGREPISFLLDDKNQINPLLVDLSSEGSPREWRCKILYQQEFPRFAEDVRYFPLLILPRYR